MESLMREEGSLGKARSVGTPYGVRGREGQKLHMDHAFVFI